MQYAPTIKIKGRIIPKYINIRLKISNYRYIKEKGAKLKIKGINKVIERLFQITGMPITQEELKVKNRNYKGATAFELLINLPMLLLAFGLAFYILSIFFGVLPTPKGNPTAYNFVINGMNEGKGIVDSGILFIIFVIIIMDLIKSYTDPSIYRAFRSLIILFLLGYASLVLGVFTTAINTALPVNTLLPQFYGALTSNYFIALIFFSLIIDIIINLRKKEERGIDLYGNNDIFG